MQVDLRIVCITNGERVEGAEKLVSLTLDIGEDNSLPYPARTLGKSLSH